MAYGNNGKEKFSAANERRYAVLLKGIFWLTKPGADYSFGSVLGLYPVESKSQQSSKHNQFHLPITLAAAESMIQSSERKVRCWPNSLGEKEEQSIKDY